ncbi:hypothetical protein PCE1_000051 [Barthelona sp. PCE]
MTSSQEGEGKTHSSTINVAEFTAKNIRSIKTLRSNVLDMRGSRRAMQMLPPFMRRRQATHNPYRVPRRLREKAKWENSKSPPGPKRIRSFRRKKRNLERSRKAAIDGKWTQLHVYHAKRFKQCKLENSDLILPYSPTQKCGRWFLRCMRHQSVMFDMSHYRLFLVEEEQQNFGSFERKCDESTDFWDVFKFGKYVLAPIFLIERIASPIRCLPFAPFFVAGRQSLSDLGEVFGIGDSRSYGEFKEGVYCFDFEDFRVNDEISTRWNPQLLTKDCDLGVFNDFLTEKDMSLLKSEKILDQKNQFVSKGIFLNTDAVYSPEINSMGAFFLVPDTIYPFMWRKLELHVRPFGLFEWFHLKLELGVLPPLDIIKVVLERSKKKLPCDFEEAEWEIVVSRKQWREQCSNLYSVYSAFSFVSNSKLYLAVRRNNDEK